MSLLNCDPFNFLLPCTLPKVLNGTKKLCIRMHHSFGTPACSGVPRERSCPMDIRMDKQKPQNTGLRNHVLVDGPQSSHKVPFRVTDAGRRPEAKLQSRNSALPHSRCCLFTCNALPIDKPFQAPQNPYLLANAWVSVAVPALPEVQVANNQA